MYEYYNLANLPVFENGTVRSLQASSYDRKYENADYAQFLYQDGEEYVLMEEVGEGCIKSIWMAVTSDETFLNFYFDGEEKPRWTTTTKGLFTGGIAELDTVGNTYEIRGHYDYDDCHAGNLFIQIPFEKGLKITASGNTRVYYHIMYEMYTDGGVHNKNVNNESFLSAFAGESNFTYKNKIEKDLTIKCGYTTFMEEESSGVIRKMTLTVDKDADISDLYIDMCFDNYRDSQLACPVQHLFAEPLGYAGVNSTAVKTEIVGDKRVMSVFFPMPWWEKNVSCFVNWGKEPIPAKLEMWIDENTYDRKNAGYFTASFYQGKTQLFGDWLLADLFGRGKIVGLTQTCIGGQYCEGNEHFYINGEISPSINGTGTEDLYLGCYWPNFRYDSPLAGCVNDVFLDNGATPEGALKTPAGYYRHFLDMPINFENGIKLYIQHGAVCQTYSEYSSTAFSYRVAERSLEQTDMIDLGSAVSKKMHAYSSTGTSYTHSGKLESDMRSQPFVLSGYRTEKGSVSFETAIRPDNKGVILRRLYDKTASNKDAKVYVDGAFAGIWNTVGENVNFTVADDDFYIPAALTEGKESIKVEIKTDKLYTDFEYKTFSRI